MKSFLVIGLGRFGTAVAKELASLGQEVLAIDRDDDNIQRIADDVTQAVRGDARDEAVLKGVGARNFDCCIVAMAADVEASVLITVMLKEMGVKQIVAKAQSEIHAHVLERIGADRVIRPESEMGERLAKRLAHTNVVDYIGSTDDFSILEIKPPKKWVGKSLIQIGIRAKYHVNVLAIHHADGISDVNPAADRVIKAEDLLVVMGTNESVESVVKLD